MNKQITTLYSLLNIRSKIEDQGLRILYLKDVWGLDQGTIAELESSTQPNISRYMKKARESKTAKDMILDFTAQELKYVQSLPRELFTDMQIIAFYSNILKLRISHPFFLSLGDESLRITALHSLGIMNKRIEELFGKSQAAISMIIKRTGDKSAKMQRSMRFDTESSVYLIEKILPKNKLTSTQNKLTMAGGQE